MQTENEKAARAHHSSNGLTNDESATSSYHVSSGAATTAIDEGSLDGTSSVAECKSACADPAASSIAGGERSTFTCRLCGEPAVPVEGSVRPALFDAVVAGVLSCVHLQCALAEQAVAT